jgi:hypothetical protein
MKKQPESRLRKIFLEEIAQLVWRRTLTVCATTERTTIGTGNSEPSNFQF